MRVDDELARLATSSATDREAFATFVASGGEAAFQRCAGPEHVTASCFVFSPGLTQTLLCFHRKGGFWVQFGGHVEPEDSSLPHTALREGREESGIADLTLVSEQIVDLDRHELHGRFACTAHWDVGFVAIVDPQAVITVSDESDDVRWFPVDALPSNTADRLDRRIENALRATRQLVHGGTVARTVTRRVALGTGIGLAAAVVLAGGGIAVNDDLLPGRSTMYRVLGLDGPDGVVPRIPSGPLVSGSLVSAHMGGRRVGYEIAYPPGTKPGTELPVAVILHGYGDDQRAAFSASMRFDAYLAQAVQMRKPFALASVAGGNGYWHPRANGTDAGAMVVDDVLPQLAARGLRATPTDRIALMGWSMGGYGALRLGGVLGSSRVAAVAVESPALWHTFQPGCQRRVR